MDKSKVIFLDVDGVLNDAATDEKSICGFIGIDDTMVMNLKHIVDNTDATIILTSTWKSEWEKNPDHCDLDGEYLNGKLNAHGIHIHDKTVDKIKDRGHGIRRYLEAHPEVEHWVVLDDDIFPDYDECGIRPHLVHTHFYAGGLTEVLAKEAIEVLNGNLGEWKEEK